jgi:protein-L-isoaspartate(D-aspartate) O-methyltransferase
VRKSATQLLVTILLIFLFLPLAVADEEKDMAQKRAQLVKELRDMGIYHEKVLAAIAIIPRENFVPENQKKFAYDHRHIKIDTWARMEPPHLVALIAQNLRPDQGVKILEIGTGTGYLTALLAHTGAEVYSIELEPEVAKQAIARLKELGMQQPTIKAGDGFHGWPEKAPFDTIYLSPSVEEIPPKLIEQIKEGGTIILTLGGTYAPQVLVVGTKEDGSVTLRPLRQVKILPMQGTIQEQ